MTFHISWHELASFRASSFDRGSTKRWSCTLHAPASASQAARPEHVISFSGSTAFMRTRVQALYLHDLAKEHHEQACVARQRLALSCATRALCHFLAPPSPSHVLHLCFPISLTADIKRQAAKQHEHGIALLCCWLHCCWRRAHLPLLNTSQISLAHRHPPTGPPHSAPTHTVPLSATSFFTTSSARAKYG